ncbi:hypothetical protein EDB89DRAFT_1905178 [Lactarius sanguifluus]|nr:hypothetical protein EDB89DRAFT_1905178 [Lactarius sanguifluus]
MGMKAARAWRGTKRRGSDNYIQRGEGERSYWIGPECSKIDGKVTDASGGGKEAMTTNSKLMALSAGFLLGWRRHLAKAKHRAGDLGAGRNEGWSYSCKASAKRSISNKLQARRVACFIDQAMVMTRVLSRGEHRNGKGRIGIAALSHSPQPSGRMQRGAMTPCAGRGVSSGDSRSGRKAGCDEELRDKEGWIAWF